MGSLLHRPHLDLPAHAIAQMVADPTSLDLWPMEFALYAFFGPSPGMIGALIGRAAVHTLRDAEHR